MLMQIVQHTPARVWVLLAALVAFGILQTRQRRMRARRVVILPVLLFGLSLAGVVSAFGANPLPLLAWAAGIGLALAAGWAPLAPRGARWLPASDRLEVPGSWLPMALILALFLLKYGVNVALALHPALASDAGFSAGSSFAYGAFSGLFLARSAGLWNVVRRSAQGPLAA